MRLSLEAIRSECVNGDYSFRDPILGPAWVDFEINNFFETGNEYFQPAPRGEWSTNIRLTRAFWEYELLKFGYLLRVP